MSQTVEITRYPNRRLYDRSRKKYVTVDDIEAMVLGGQDIRVRDSKSDKDLTRTILTQILLERHPARMKMFPVAFLHAILRADEMALNWLTVYFGQAVSLMEGLQNSTGANLVPGISFWQSLLPGAGGSDANESTSGKTPPPQDQPARENDGQTPQELLAKLVDMERRLNQLERGSSIDDE